MTDVALEADCLPTPVLLIFKSTTTKIDKARYAQGPHHAQWVSARYLYLRGSRLRPIARLFAPHFARWRAVDAGPPLSSGLLPLGQHLVQPSGSRCCAPPRFSGPDESDRRCSRGTNLGSYLIVPKAAGNWNNTCRARCVASSSATTKCATSWSNRQSSSYGSGTHAKSANWRELTGSR